MNTFRTPQEQLQEIGKQLEEHNNLAFTLAEELAFLAELAVEPGSERELKLSVRGC